MPLVSKSVRFLRDLLPRSGAKRTSLKLRLDSRFKYRESIASFRSAKSRKYVAVRRCQCWTLISRQ